MKVNVLTPVRNGGPYGWGRNLTECLNATNRHVASHLHEPGEVLSAPVRSRADIVHTAVPLSFRLWKKPVVLTVHGDYSIENNIWKLMYPQAVRMADAVTTPSRFLKDRLGLDNADIIPNAVFPERFGVRKLRSDRAINLVTVTKFYFQDKAQGVLDLLRMIEQARKGCDDELRLTVVGGGQYLWPVVRRAAAFDVKVRFTGFLPDPSRIMRTGDIFVYYSTHDNFPVAFLEAMASGLPIVTNDVGAAREIVTSGTDGFVSVTDREYIDNLSRLITNGRLRRIMGERARRTVEERFNWQKIAARYVSLYEDLLS